MSASDQGESATTEVGFDSSALGTKEHWDEQYKTELKNFEEIRDIGEVWFGEDSVERVSRWIERQQLARNSAIIDLGCGNGASLLALRERGYTDLTGVDYSPAAIELAQKIAAKDNSDIHYEVCDLLQESFPGSSETLRRKYNICLDKGTYDAVSLCPKDSATKRRIYRNNVGKLTTEGGLFIITSCNWTVDELKSFYSGKGFDFRCVIPTPTLRFGGCEGGTTSVVVFTKL